MLVSKVAIYMDYFEGLGRFECPFKNTHVDCSRLVQPIEGEEQWERSNVLLWLQKYFVCIPSSYQHPLTIQSLHGRKTVEQIYFENVSPTALLFKLIAKLC